MVYQCWTINCHEWDYNVVDVYTLTTRKSDLLRSNIIINKNIFLEVQMKKIKMKTYYTSCKNDTASTRQMYKKSKEDTVYLGSDQFQFI